MVLEQWASDPEKKVESFNRFLNADWNTILKSFSKLKEEKDRQIQSELEQMLHSN